MENVKKFLQMAEKIIRMQESVIGSLAWDKARKVKGLNISRLDNVISMLGDEREVINRLVEEYESIFGKVSYEVCKKAVKDLIAEIPPEDVPSIFSKSFKSSEIKKIPEKLYKQNLDLAVKLEETEKNLNLEKHLRKNFTKESEEAIRKIENAILNKNINGEK